MKSIEISRSELIKLYDNLSSKEAALSLGVCLQTFYNMLDAAEIPRKRKNFIRGENIKFVIKD